MKKLAGMVAVLTLAGCAIQPDQASNGSPSGGDLIATYMGPARNRLAACSASFATKYSSLQGEAETLNAAYDSYCSKEEADVIVAADNVERDTGGLSIERAHYNGNHVIDDLRKITVGGIIRSRVAQRPARVPHKTTDTI